MRDLPGVNELHRPNTEYNRDVLSIIEIASKTKNTRDCLDVLGGVKTLKDTEKKSINRDEMKLQSVEYISFSRGAKEEERDDR